MSDRVVRLYRTHGEDRVAVVSTEPSHAQPAKLLVRIARGTSAQQLTSGNTFGPYSAEETDQQFDQLVDSLIAEGFVESGLGELLADLDDPQSAVRARAALRLGWRRSAVAVDPLLARLDGAVDELCSYIDALGAIGDARAIPAVQAQAQKKLLSRRRSAVEALRNLDDVVGLAEAHQQGLSRMPSAVQDAYHSSHQNPDALTAALQKVDSKKLGLVLDGLYELASPAAAAAVRGALEKLDFGRPFVWRYVKSIMKRSMLRGDFVVFGWLAHRIERQSRTSTGVKANVKSGYDGQQRNSSIFRRKTQQFVRRLCWRYLRRLAHHRGELYPLAAAEAIVHYTPQDAQAPVGLRGQFADCYLLHRVLWGASARFRLDERRLRFRFASAKHAQSNPPASLREEPFPDLWDAQPKAYLRLLAAGLPEVHEFALQAMDRAHPQLLQTATVDELLPMLSAPHERTLQLAAAELEKRFDPHQPDWALLDQLVEDDRSIVVEVAGRWLRQSAPLWTGDADRIIVYLRARHGVLQKLVVELLQSHPLSTTTKAALADRVLALAQAPGAEQLEGVAKAARMFLLEEITARLTMDAALAMISEGAPAAQALAAEALSRRQGVLEELGLERLAALGIHQVAAVRLAAHTLLRQAQQELIENPAILFVLIESQWQDSQSVAMELLRSLFDWSQAPLEPLLGLLDSNSPHAQDFGKEMARRRLASLGAAEGEPFDPAQLVRRLSEHPHPNMRRFALELMESYLPSGVEPLNQLEPFFRAVLFDTWPQQKTKHGVVRFLLKRGLQDERQARFAVRLFAALAHVRQQEDFEQAIAALTRLQLAYPLLKTPAVLKIAS